jgi:hypothetical protein
LNDTAFVNLKEYSNDFVWYENTPPKIIFWRYTRLCGVLFAPENSCCFSGSQ